MWELKVIITLAAIGFICGYDLASYNIMRKIDPSYPKKNKWLLFGYNTFKVRQSYKRYKENGG